MFVNLASPEPVECEGMRQESCCLLRMRSVGRAVSTPHFGEMEGLVRIRDFTNFAEGKEFEATICAMRVWASRDTDCHRAIGLTKDCNQY